MTNCIFSWYYILSGGGIPESRRASELSELLGVKILPSQVLLWDFILFLYDLLVVICFLVYPWPPLFDCGTVCIAVSFSWYRFYRVIHLLKVSWKGICIFIDFEVFFILLFYAHVFNFKKWHVPRNLPSFFFFFVAVVAVDLPFSFIFNLVTTIPC
jgi:hypothetical protein